jgi:hypothetical protein
LELFFFGLVFGDSFGFALFLLRGYEGLFFLVFSHGTLDEFGGFESCFGCQFLILFLQINLLLLPKHDEIISPLV